MDAHEQAALQKILDDAVAQRQELDVVIRHVAKRLGVPAPTGPAGGGRSSNGLNNAGVDPVENTVAAEYYGLTSTDAAYAVLSKFGSRQNTLKTKQLYDAIKKGGVAIQNEDGLYRSLARSNRFRKVGRGLWGLSEWYPTTAKPARKTDLTNISPLAASDSDEADEGNAVTEVQTA
jgi:hypothetical protein